MWCSLCCEIHTQPDLRLMSFLSRPSNILELLPLHTLLRHVRKKPIFHRQSAAQTVQNSCLWAQEKKDGRGARCDLKRFAQLFLEKTTEVRRRSCPEFDNTTAELFMSSCSAKRFKKFGSVCVCQGTRTCNTHWDRAPLHNRSVHCVAKFSTSIQPQQLRKNKSFVQRRLRKTCVSPLDITAQIDSKSTVGHKCARPSIYHSRRRPTSRNTLWASVFKNTSVEVFATHTPTISSGLWAVDTYEQSWLTSKSLTK